MQVNKPVNTVGRPNVAQSPQAPATVASDEPISAVPRVDKVQISDAGRALLGDSISGEASEQLANQNADATATSDTAETQASSLDPARAQDLRAKILAGAYLTLDAADQVARAIIRSGDV